MPANTHVHKTVTISSTAQSMTDMGFTAAQLAQSTRCWVTGDGGNMRYRFDGVPTATVGHLFLDTITYETRQGEGSIANLRLIAQTADVNCNIEVETYV